MTENCKNCRFSRPQWDNGARLLYCQRRAPAPLNATFHYLCELVRDIAWSARQSANIELPKEDDRSDELNKEATEALHYSFWPDVDWDDWCGEWERKQ